MTKKKVKVPTEPIKKDLPKIERKYKVQLLDESGKVINEVDFDSKVDFEASKIDDTFVKAVRLFEWVEHEGVMKLVKKGLMKFHELFSGHK